MNLSQGQLGKQNLKRALAKMCNETMHGKRWLDDAHSPVLDDKVSTKSQLLLEKVAAYT